MEKIDKIVRILKVGKNLNAKMAIFIRMFTITNFKQVFDKKKLLLILK